MRLRNKKTGVIGEVGYISTSTGDILVSDIHDQEKWYRYKSLAGLNAEWEDYEEPKTFFTIYYDGTISEFKDGDDEQIRDMKAIGNYFSSREEAEKAVERLRAWERLKDKGFRFLGVKGLDYAIDFEINPPYTHITFDEYTATEDQKEFYNDLMLLFGGEE